MFGFDLRQEQPEGGYEFGVFWAVMIAVFAVLGGGRYSVDCELWRSEPGPAAPA
jgi:hypothetical protein